jgi:hypothetical protein
VISLIVGRIEVYVSGVGASQAPGVSQTVPRPSPARGPREHADKSTVMNAEPFPISETTARLGRIAILWRGDEAARRSATADNSRFKVVFAALADVGVDAEPVVYEDDVLDAVRAQPRSIVKSIMRRATIGAFVASIALSVLIALTDTSAFARGGGGGHDGGGGHGGGGGFAAHGGGGCNGFLDADQSKTFHGAVESLDRHGCPLSSEEAGKNNDVAEKQTGVIDCIECIWHGGRCRGYAPKRVGAKG